MCPVFPQQTSASYSKELLRPEDNRHLSDAIRTHRVSRWRFFGPMAGWCVHTCCRYTPPAYQQEQVGQIPASRSPRQRPPLIGVNVGLPRTDELAPGGANAFVPVKALDRHWPGDTPPLVRPSTNMSWQGKYASSLHENPARRNVEGVELCNYSSAAGTGIWADAGSCRSEFLVHESWVHRDAACQ